MLYICLVKSVWSTDPLEFFASFITDLEQLAIRRKAQMKVNFNELETVIKKVRYPGTDQYSKTQSKGEGECLWAWMLGHFGRGERFVYSCKCKRIKLITFRGMFNNNVMYCQYFGSTAHSMISIWLNPLNTVSCTRARYSSDIYRESLSVCFFQTWGHTNMNWHYDFPWWGEKSRFCSQSPRN